jgi:hypothetical protein
MCFNLLEQDKASERDLKSTLPEVDASRYATDLFVGTAPAIFTKDIPNQLLAIESSSGLTKL